MSYPWASYHPGMGSAGGAHHHMGHMGQTGPGPGPGGGGPSGIAGSTGLSSNSAAAAAAAHYGAAMNPFAAASAAQSPWLHYNAMAAQNAAAAHHNSTMTAMAADPFNPFMANFYHHAAAQSHHANDPSANAMFSNHHAAAFHSQSKAAQQHYASAATTAQALARSAASFPAASFSTSSHAPPTNPHNAMQDFKISLQSASASQCSTSTGSSGWNKNISSSSKAGTSPFGILPHEAVSSKRGHSSSSACSIESKSPSTKSSPHATKSQIGITQEANNDSHSSAQWSNSQRRLNCQQSQQQQSANSQFNIEPQMQGMMGTGNMNNMNMAAMNMQAFAGINYNHAAMNAAVTGSQTSQYVNTNNYVNNKHNYNSTTSATAVSSKSRNQSHTTHPLIKNAHGEIITQPCGPMMAANDLNPSHQSYTNTGHDSAGFNANSGTSKIIPANSRCSSAASNHTIASQSDNPFNNSGNNLSGNGSSIGYSTSPAISQTSNYNNSSYGMSSNQTHLNRLAAATAAYPTPPLSANTSGSGHSSTGSHSTTPTVGSMNGHFGTTSCMLNAISGHQATTGAAIVGSGGSSATGELINESCLASIVDNVPPIVHNGAPDLPNLTIDPEFELGASTKATKRKEKSHKKKKKDKHEGSYHTNNQNEATQQFMQPFGGQYAYSMNQSAFMGQQAQMFNMNSTAHSHLIGVNSYAGSADAGQSFGNNGAYFVSSQSNLNNKPSYPNIDDLNLLSDMAQSTPCNIIGISGHQYQSPAQMSSGPDNSHAVDGYQNIIDHSATHTAHSANFNNQISRKDDAFLTNNNSVERNLVSQQTMAHHNGTSVDSGSQSNVGIDEIPKEKSKRGRKRKSADEEGDIDGLTKSKTKKERSRKRFQLSEIDQHDANFATTAYATVSGAGGSKSNSSSAYATHSSGNEASTQKVTKTANNRDPIDEYEFTDSPPLSTAKSSGPINKTCSNKFAKLGTKSVSTVANSNVNPAKKPLLNGQEAPREKRKYTKRVKTEVNPSPANDASQQTNKPEHQQPASCDKKCSNPSKEAALAISISANEKSEASSASDKTASNCIQSSYLSHKDAIRVNGNVTASSLHQQSSSNGQTSETGVALNGEQSMTDNSKDASSLNAAHYSHSLPASASSSVSIKLESGNHVGSISSHKSSATAKLAAQRPSKSASNSTQSTPTPTPNAGNGHPPRRRSSDKKAPLREGNMRTGDYVVALKEKNTDWPLLWRIEGKSLLQRFEVREENGKMVYQNTCSYSAWNPTVKTQYCGVDVRILASSRAKIIVEKLYLASERPEKGPEPGDKDTPTGDKDKDSSSVISNSNNSTASPDDSGEQHQEDFEVFIQTLISQALDPNFITEIVKENDEYFLKHMEAIEEVCSRKKAKFFTNFKWDAPAVKLVETFPELEVLPQANVGDLRCKFCYEAWSTKMAHFTGTPLDQVTLDPIPADKIPDFKSPKLAVCEPCVERVALYSSLVHQKWNFYCKCRNKVNDAKAKDAAKESHVILEECLQDSKWIEQLFADLEEIWAACDNLAR